MKLSAKQRPQRPCSHQRRVRRSLRWGAAARTRKLAAGHGHQTPDTDDQTPGADGLTTPRGGSEAQARRIRGPGAEGQTPRRGGPDTRAGSARSRPDPVSWKRTRVTARTRMPESGPTPMRYTRGRAQRQPRYPDRAGDRRRNDPAPTVVTPSVRPRQRHPRRPAPAPGGMTGHRPSLHPLHDRTPPGPSGYRTPRQAPPGTLVFSASFS
jgi:hypothetical protein